MAVCKAQQHNINVLGFWDRLISSPQFLAAKHEVLRPYMTGVERMMRWKASLANEFTRPLQMQQRLNKKEKRLLHRALELIDAVGMEPKAADSYTFKMEGTRPSGAPLDLVGSKPGDTITLTGDTAKAFTALRKTINSFYTHMVRSTKASFGYDPDIATSSIENKEEREFIEELEASRKPGYMPRMRVGDVGFTMTLPDGREHFYVASPQGTDRIKFGKSRLNAAIAEADRIKASLKKKYKLEDSAFSPVRTMEVDSIIDEVSKGNIDTFEGLMAVMMSAKDTKTLSIKDSNGDLVTPVRALFDRMQVLKKSQSFKRTQIKRKDIPGYLHDANFDNYFENALNAYLLRGADFLASQYTHRDRVDAINALAKDKDGVNLTKWARDHSNALGEPQSLAWMKGVAFHWALGFNISSAAVNLTQNLHTTFPYLTMMSGNPMKASSLMMSAFKDMSRLLEKKGTMGFDPDQIFDLAKARKLLPRDEADFLEMLTQTGTTRPLMTEELADNNGLVNYGPAYDKLAPALRKMMNMSTMLFSGVEQANRITAALAAYRLYKSDPKARARAAKWKAENSAYANEPDSPEFLARLAVEDTQGVITRENRAAFMQGELSSVVFQFQQYPMMMLELMRKTYRFSDKKAAAQMFGLMAMGIMATAGFWGLPFAIPTKKLIEGLSDAASPYLGNNPVSLDAPMRQVGIELGRMFGSDDPAVIGDYFTNGFSRALGVDLSKRTALEIIPTDFFSGNTMDVAGPFAGLVLGGFQQANAYWNAGYPTLAFASLLPLAMRNVAQGASRLAADSDAERFITPSTGATQIPAGSSTPLERTAKALGFTPTRFARIREQSEALSADPAKTRRLAVQKSVASDLLDAQLAQTPESREYWENRARQTLDDAAAADREQEDLRQRIILDPQEFAQGIAERLKKSLEGPLGPEAMKSRGSKKVQALNADRLRDIMPEVK